MTAGGESITMQHARYGKCDSAFLIKQLDSMPACTMSGAITLILLNLYYIPAMPDATEYTIASVDASNGAGFDGGDFSPNH